MGEDQIGQALKGSDAVISPAGVPRKPRIYDGLVNINESIVKFHCTASSMFCHNALINMISNPVNLMVSPADVFTRVGIYNEKKLGLQAKTFRFGKTDDPISDGVLVDGCYDGKPILPLYAQDSSVYKRFEQWMNEHGRVYKDEIEKAKRFKIFADRLKAIESFNKEGHSWKKGLNNFSDLTSEEVKAKYLSGLLPVRDDLFDVSNVNIGFLGLSTPFGVQCNLFSLVQF